MAVFFLKINSNSAYFGVIRPLQGAGRQTAFPMQIPTFSIQSALVQPMGVQAVSQESGVIVDTG
jgi:hypothetical protein